MPRFAYDDQLATAQPSRSCAAALRAAMQALGATVDLGGEAAVEAEMGTQWFRLVGGVLGSAEKLPVHLHGHVEDMGSERMVYLRVAENMGLGVMYGMEKKYRQHCQDLLGRLTNHVREQLQTAQQ